MITLPIMRPINEVDVELLENEFAKGYHDENRTMYVSIFNNHGHMVNITDHLSSSWSVLWREASEFFDTFLAEDNDLADMVGKMFFASEGYYKLMALHQ